MLDAIFRESEHRRLRAALGEGWQVDSNFHDGHVIVLAWNEAEGPPPRWIDGDLKYKQPFGFDWVFVRGEGNETDWNMLVQEIRTHFNQAEQQFKQQIAERAQMPV